MNILITGGTGFIGQTLCPALLAAGHKLTIFSRYPGRVEAMFGNQVTALSAIKTLTKSHEFDAVINLSGAPIFGELWSEERKKKLLESRIDITERLIEFIARAEIKPKVFLSGSAIGFYGNQDDIIIDEESPAHGDDFGHQLCALWEQTADKAKEHGVRVCKLRTGLVIGPNGGFLQSLILPFKLCVGGKMGSGMQWMPWIHIDDHVAICQKLLEDETLEGAFNLTGPNPVINKEFTRILAKVLHRPAVIPLPAFALKFLLGEMSQLLLGSQRVIPRRMLEADYQFKYPELEAAITDAIQS